jgi:hypothetical protein
VLRGLLPPQLVQPLEKIQPYSFIIFLLLFLFGSRVLNLILFNPSALITSWLMGF